MTANSTIAWPPSRVRGCRITEALMGWGEGVWRARASCRGPADETSPVLERGDDVRERALDGGREQAQRDHDSDRDDAEDDGVLRHGLAGLVLDLVQVLVQ